MTHPLTTLAPGIVYSDLTFQGRPRVIATALLTGRDGVAVVDPGPTSSLPVLKRSLSAVGASIADVTTLLLTHIHLDHAGASGTLVRENPRMKIYVHRAGAPHMVDPSKLLASAGRLYGDEMDRLWGEVAPVPADAITALGGGETVTAGDRAWAVAHTPGHASHHVSYFSSDTGVAFVGDTAGVQIVPGGFVLPPTPPPDVDLPLWTTSLATIERWHPQTLFLTHFGPTTTEVRAHLAELRDHLQLFEKFASDAIEQQTDEEAREQRFIDEVRQQLRRRMPETRVNDYEVAGRFDLNWRGLARYLTKRAKQA
jgi:glyoxylase-like metal-dependent hydrolase (beta-lactamase superfamily II)